MERANYQPDIDGLRAIAILIVVFFHVGFSQFSGGYVGVDVFFVISGFLITRLIRNEIITTQSFSYANFYVRRARRLLPALFFTLLLSSIFAVTLLTPIYLKQYFGSLIHATVSLSNFFFWLQSGYFDVDSSFKPLLHTWSLSVEEQFYFFWPALLTFLLLNKSKKAAPLTILILSILSLWLDNIFADGSPDLLIKWSPTVSSWFAEGSSTIYYLTPFRIFEFGIGAILVWFTDHRIKQNLILEIMLILGILMIFYSTFVFTKDTLFPSYNALIPCIGAAFSIYSGSAKYSGYLLRNRVSVGIGLISYSLYLIHWPVIVFYKYFKYGELTILEKFIICIVCVLLSYIMFRFIETPFRHSAYIKNKSGSTIGFAFSLAAIVIILPASNGWANNGWPGRFSHSGIIISEEESKSANETRYNYLKSNKGCHVIHNENCKMDANIQILTFGNSHELDAYNALFSVYGDRPDINIISFGTTYGCDFKLLKGSVVTTKNAANNNCSERANILNDISFLDNLDIVAFSAHMPLTWGADLIKILNHLKLRKPDLKIIFFSGYIGTRPYRCDELINRFGNFDVCKKPLFAKYYASNEREKILSLPLAKSNFLYIDKINLFCKDRLQENCIVNINNTPAFYDGDHLSFSFARFLGKKASIVYKKELSSLGL